MGSPNINTDENAIAMMNATQQANKNQASHEPVEESKDPVTESEDLSKSVKKSKGSKIKVRSSSSQNKNGT